MGGDDPKALECGGGERFPRGFLKRSFQKQTKVPP